MAFSFRIVQLADITGTDPISGSTSDDTHTVGSTVGDLLSFSSSGDVVAQTADGDFPDDGGANLVAPVTINGVTWPAGSEIEADWEIITVDAATGLYYRITGLYIENAPVGVVVSRAWDASVGDYVDGQGGLYQPGTVLTQIDGDDLDGTPNASQFATDSAYSAYGAQEGIGNDAVLNSSNGVMLCFSGETRIAVPAGPRPAWALRPGMLVETLDHGAQPLRWVGRTVPGAGERAQERSTWPMRIRAGALGAGLPDEDLFVSAQHRMLLRSAIVQRMCGCPEVLIAARQLRHLPGIAPVPPASLAYVHLLLERHEILIANGAPAESLFPGDRALLALPSQVVPLLPSPAVPARPFVEGARARRLVLRHRRNRRPLLSAPVETETAEMTSGLVTVGAARSLQFSR